MPGDANGELDELVASTSTLDEALDASAADPSPREEPTAGSQDREAPGTTPDTQHGDGAPSKEPSDTKPGATDDDEGLSPAEKAVIDQLSGPSPTDAATPASKTQDTDAEGAETTVPQRGQPTGGTALSSEEEAQLAPKARKAFAAMRTQSRDLQRQLKELRPVAEEGTRILAAFDRFQGSDDLKDVDEQQHVGMVRLQAAMNRGYEAIKAGKNLSPQDKHLLEHIAPVYDRVLRDLGVPRPSSLPTPYDGFLKPEHQELIDNQVFTEQAVRQMIAIERAGKAAKADEATAERRAPLVNPTKVDETPVPVRTAARTTREHPEEGKYKGLARAYLSERGVDTAAQSRHYTTKLWPIIIDELIAKNPKLQGLDPVEEFNKSKPATRYRLIEMAQQRWERRAQTTGRQEPGTTKRPHVPARARPPLTQQHTAGARVPRTPDRRPVDREEDVIRRLDPQGRGRTDT
jgi:hypothetical protein